MAQNRQKGQKKHINIPIDTLGKHTRPQASLPGTGAPSPRRVYAPELSRNRISLLDIAKRIVHAGV